MQKISVVLYIYIFSFGMTFIFEIYNTVKTKIGINAHSTAKLNEWKILYYDISLLFHSKNERIPFFQQGNICFTGLLHIKARL